MYQPTKPQFIQLPKQLPPGQVAAAVTLDQVNGTTQTVFLNQALTTYFDSLHPYVVQVFFRPQAKQPPKPTAHAVTENQPIRKNIVLISSKASKAKPALKPADPDLDVLFTTSHEPLSLHHASPWKQICNQLFASWQTAQIYHRFLRRLFNQPAHRTVYATVLKSGQLFQWLFSAMLSTIKHGQQAIKVVYQAVQQFVNNFIGVLIASFNGVQRMVSTVQTAVQTVTQAITFQRKTRFEDLLAPEFMENLEHIEGSNHLPSAPFQAVSIHAKPQPEKQISKQMVEPYQLVSVLAPQEVPLPEPFLNPLEAVAPIELNTTANTMLISQNQFLTRSINNLAARYFESGQ